MKRLVIALAIASAVVVGGGTARGSDVSEEYDESVLYPLRLAYHVIHPVGFAAEWLIGRPFHFIISRPYLDRFFGYRSTDEEGAYRRLDERM